MANSNTSMTDKKLSAMKSPTVPPIFAMNVMNGIDGCSIFSSIARLSSRMYTLANLLLICAYVKLLIGSRVAFISWA